jgi:RecB family endonuclease NucS
MWFDVGLGLGKPIPQGTTADLAFMWERNTQKRADVILETAEDISLVELRFKAQPNAIGRLLTYLDLLEPDAPWGKPIHPLLVTDQLDAEVRSSAEKRGIRYIVI